jgi:4-hydroxyacetophenone monooxygenase
MRAGLALDKLRQVSLAELVSDETEQVDPAIDLARLETALESANLPALLMVLFQLTGDRAWLGAGFAPRPVFGVRDDRSGGFDEQVAERIRRAAHSAVVAWARGAGPALPTPDPGVLSEMISVCMGEPVPREYGEMMAADMGFASTVPALSPPDADSVVDVVIVGAGVSSLAAAHELISNGARVTVLEQNSSIGGTWDDNRYPGCGVDTPSHLYSFSFAPRNWSSHFSRRAEILEYLSDVADQIDFVSKVRFGRRVVSATYHSGTCRWAIVAVDADGAEEQYSANIVIWAVGALSEPSVPAIAGQQNFQGMQWHAARWPAGMSLDGKRVAVIGSGATAMQVVPAIAPDVARLTVLQRSPHWIAPNSDYFGRFGDDERWLIETLPFYQKWLRLRLACIFNDRSYPALCVDPDWTKRTDSINETSDRVRAYFSQYLREELVGREDLVKKVLPTYPPFGKRMLIDNGWFQALRRDNVDLVAAGISRLTPTGVELEDGTAIAVDVVIYATGFQPHRMLQGVDVVGRDGRSLRDVWRDDDAFAYLGMAVHGFPNLFVMFGPNTNLGHGGSWIFMAECQARYVASAIEQMRRHSLGAIEVRRDVMERFVAEVDKAHTGMVWSHTGMSTWYRNSKGRVVSNWPWRVVDYWQRTRGADLADFICISAKRSADARPGTEEDERAIVRVLHAYCRAVDRGDEALLRSCYHPDAIDDHGLVKARRDHFVAWSMRHIREGVARRKRLTTHSVMNVLTDIRDDVADVESQFFASHVEPSDQGIRVDEIHGRYLDQFVRRDGQWKILYRRTVHDWSLRRSGEPPPFTAAMADNLQGSLLPDDPLYMRTDNADITPAEAPNV